MTPMIVDHPLLQHKISLLRNKQTGTKEFRDLVSEIATLLCYEATRDLPLEEVEIETPITMARTKVLAGRKLALVPLLRAGMGMLDGMLSLIPAAKVGFIGLYRDETTLKPVEYFCKLPADIAERDVLVLDPMLATGGSAVDAIAQIKKHGAKRIKEAVSVPVFAVYGIQTGEQAEAVLSDTGVEMVNIGRGILVNYNWANDVKAGRDPGRCLYCPTCMWRVDPSKCAGRLLHERKSQTGAAGRE